MAAEAAILLVKVTLKAVDQVAAVMPILHILVLARQPHREVNLDKVEPMDLVFQAQVLDKVSQSAGKSAVRVALEVLEG